VPISEPRSREYAYSPYRITRRSTLVYETAP
jgi:hypothetical protein